MTPHEIQTQMALFNQANVRTEGTMLFHHDHETEDDIISTTAIDLIPSNISRIVFVSHGAEPNVDIEGSKTFWKTMAEELAMAVSTDV